MLQALRPGSRRSQANRVEVIEAPWAGWNSRDDITDMEPNEAVELENLIPGQGNVSVRKGHASHVTGLTSVVRSVMSYEPPTGVPKIFAANATAIYDVTTAEAAATNVVLHNRDLTNAAWTKTNVTAVKDQTGPDGVTNSASKITSTAGNGTCLQAITLASSARFQTCYIKRLVGTGDIEMTMDNGATWTAVTVTAGWTRVTIPTQTLADPTVGFRIVTSGDSVAIDLVQNEEGAAATSAIETAAAAVTRAASTVGAPVQASLSNGNWQHVVYSTSGGDFLVIANGADSVRYFDGTAWTVPSITGVTSSSLITVTSHQSRLWFVQKDTQKVWYLDTLAVAGAANSIEFGGLSKLGGYLMAMASWSRDSGDGIENLAAFITNKGEVHIYSGTDPSSATTWAWVGTFKVAPPVGRRCVVKVGADVGIITTQGLVPLSGVLGQAESAQGKVAITDKIRHSFTDAYSASPSATGWEVTEYPLGLLLILNVPVTGDTEYVQFAMNTATGAWCKFTGLNGYTWCVSGTDLFFGGVDGTVYKYTGTTDDGDEITFKAVSSFRLFGSANVKHARRILPRFTGPVGYRPQIGLRFDYSEFERLSAASVSPVAGTLWGEGLWGEFYWAPSQRPNNTWQGVSGKGTSVAVVIKGAVNNGLSYQGAKLEFEVGHHL